MLVVRIATSVWPVTLFGTPDESLENQVLHALVGLEVHVHLMAINAVCGIVSKVYGKACVVVAVRILIDMSSRWKETIAGLGPIR